MRVIQGLWAAVVRRHQSEAMVGAQRQAVHGCPQAGTVHSLADFRVGGFGGSERKSLFTACRRQEMVEIEKRTVSACLEPAGNYHKGHRCGCWCNETIGRCNETHAAWDVGTVTILRHPLVQ